MLRTLKRSLALRISLAVGIPLASANALALWMLDERGVRGREALPAAALLLAVLTGSLAVALRVFLLRPLRKLEEAMHRAETGDLLTRVEGGDDDMGRLAEAFNGMLARITDLKVAALETGREVHRMHEQLELKEEIEHQARRIEETNRRLEARLRELTLLFDITRSISSTLELGELMRLVTEMVGVTLGFSEFAVLLSDERTGELVVRATYGFPDGDDVEGIRFAVGEGISGEAARTGEFVLVRDVSREPAFLFYKGKQHHGGSFLSVPMKHKDRVLGVLNFSRPEPNAFSSEEIKLLISVAGQAALAIANARLYQETVELSLTDPLTGIHNRRHLFSRLEMEIARAQRFGSEVSLVMIDIDHFKQFNDHNGHPAGDEVLKGVASVIESSIRRIDTLARFGGEEFCVVLPGTSKVAAAEVAEKLRRAVERETFLGGERQPGGRVTISAGFATYPSDAADAVVLIDAADRALYASKRDGRNRVTSYRPALLPRSPGDELQVG